MSDDESKAEPSKRWLFERQAELDEAGPEHSGAHPARIRRKPAAPPRGDRDPLDDAPLSARDLYCTGGATLRHDGLSVRCQR